MIIHSIRANNVLKYEQLDLQDLPPQGVIAISGFNESGKSTIGETICFALFGRTFSIDEGDLDKIIRWGESDCSVTIQFSNDRPDTPADELYAITRMLDCDGNHSAKLYKVYNEEHPIARGVDRVEEALFELTSIEFEEFIESFYLAQREITTPHPHSYALKTMAGIATMEHCSNNIYNDIQSDVEAADALVSQIAQVEEEITELGIENGHLDALSAQHSEALQTKAQTDEARADYQSCVDKYHEAAPELSRYLSKKSRASFWRFIYFMLAAGLLALWWIVVKMTDAAIHEQIMQLIQSSLPQVTAQYFPYFLYVGGASVVLFFFFWAASISHKGNIDRLSQAGIDLAEKMRQLDSSRNLSSNEERTLQLNQVTASQAVGPQLSTVTDPDLSYFVQQQELQADQISQLSEAVAVERDRVNRASERQEKIAALQSQADDKAARNQTRELATELLAGATGHLSKRFNHIIRDHVGKTLPLFTENRYEHLQIDDDLSVRVFSNEKHDFMDLDEISSGTQRQIMLAVRLALSQEMVSRKVHTQQFLILDEPFAFFDEERTARSLSVLPELSDDLPQIWIIAQTFPDTMNFEQSIFCERDTTARLS